jgi:hypothetical protein
MSPKGSGGNYTPTRRPATFTIEEMQAIADLNTKQANDFFALFERSSIKWVIYAAGTAAVLDIMHTLFLAARFLLRFDHF